MLVVFLFLFAGLLQVPEDIVIRIAMNPSRALANLLQGKGPWYREGRA